MNKVSLAPPLTDHFLSALVDELDNDAALGIILGGSYARGEATLLSDVDVAFFVRDEAGPSPKRYSYRDGYLLSIATKTIAGVREEVSKPNRAIWVVPGLSHYKLLLDKDGSVGKLLGDIETFTWEPLQIAADGYASRSVAALVEGVHKILGEVLKGDDLAVSYATTNLLHGLTEAVAVQRGVLIKSDNTYYWQVQESVGLASDWTRYHRLAIGVDRDLTEPLPVRSRSISALQLYKETVELLRSIMQSEHLTVAEQAMRIIDEYHPRLMS